MSRSYRATAQVATHSGRKTGARAGKRKLRPGGAKKETFVDSDAL